MPYPALKTPLSANQPTIDIDFEVFSEADLTVVGLHNYAYHPSTRIICMAYRDERNHLTRLWRPGREHKLPPLYVLRAHNAMFELTIIKALGEMYNIPIPQSFVCTAAQAAVMSYPRSLEGASKAMKLPLIKDTEGKGVMLRVTKPRNPSKKNPETTWFFDKTKMNRTYQYCIQDVDVECHIDHHTRPLSPNENKIYLLDAKINQRGIQIDTKLCCMALKQADKAIEAINRELYWEVTNCHVTSITKTKPFKAWMLTQGHDIPSIAKDVVKELLKGRNLKPCVRRALQLRQAGSLTSIAKYRKILDWTDSEGILRHILMYHGAGPGRWTGKGPQLQNLPRGTIKAEALPKAVNDIKNGQMDEWDNPMAVISSCVRSALIPRPGKTLLCGDYASIEARVLSWASGEADMLAILASGEDVYRHMAVEIYKKDFDTITSEERTIGKSAILGLGFQMGAQTFVDDVFEKAGVVITLEFAKKVVKTYRKNHPHIKSFWTDMEQAMIDATTNRGQDFPVGPVTFRGHTDINAVTVQLPSERLLWYIEPKVLAGRYGPKTSHMRVNSKTRKWERRDTYGGMLTENSVQAIARDLMANAMLNIEKEHDILVTIHDEILCETTDPDTDAYEELMEAKPRWAKNIPVKAEAWAGERYKK